MPVAALVNSLRGQFAPGLVGGAQRGELRGLGEGIAGAEQAQRQREQSGDAVLQSACEAARDGAHGGFR
jgi:hypothetical protein